MKRILCFFFITLFFISVASGEKLCCSSNGTLKSSVIDTADTHQDHFDQNTHSDQEKHQSHHQCLGCSHSPVFVATNVIVVKYETLVKNNFIDKYNFIPHPFLDGPFQPPKSLI